MSDQKAAETIIATSLANYPDRWRKEKSATPEFHKWVRDDGISLSLFTPFSGKPEWSFSAGDGWSVSAKETALLRDAVKAWEQAKTSDAIFKILTSDANAASPSHGREVRGPGEGS